ncbi:Gti1/Pac2 family-domain-containing protein, partial [Umbelopsis sp. PMI_123]
METYFGYIKCPQDALTLFKACQLGILPRVRRRLSDRERSDIRSGSIFVWYEKEAGMRRWTDGRSWSPSRVSGSFLTYKELNCKQKKRLLQSTHVTYKEQGLIKQSFSITTKPSEKIHMISYYSEADLANKKLICPTEDPRI